MPATSPSFSIVTVCFNSVRTLEAALASVVAQNWANREHIVIDGGSTDGTLDIIARRHRTLAKVVSEPDRGIYDAMNKGLALATGDVVAFLNSDDRYIDTEVLSDVAEALAQNDLDAVFGDVDFVHPGDPDRVVRRFDSGRFHPARLKMGVMPAHPALFVRKSVFDRVGPFNPDYRIAGDFEFIARAFGDGGLHYKYLPRVLVRMQTGGASTGGIRSTLKLNAEILRACRENGIPTSALQLAMRYPAKFTEWLRR